MRSRDSRATTPEFPDDAILGPFESKESEPTS